MAISPKLYDTAVYEEIPSTVRSAADFPRPPASRLFSPVLSSASALPVVDHAVRRQVLSTARVFNPLDPYHIRTLRRHHRDTFEALRIIGADPLDGAKVLNRYTAKAKAENYGNIGIHCIGSALIASVIVDALVARGLEPDRGEKIIRLALAHDFNKPGEIMRRSAKQLGVYQGDPYSDEAYLEEKQFLIKQGLPADTAQLVLQAGQLTGHTSVQRFIEVVDGEWFVALDGNEMTMIPLLADSMMYTSKPIFSDDLKEQPINAIMTFEERMVASMFHSESPGYGYPWMWKEGLACNRNGVVKAVKDIHRPGRGFKVIGHYAFLQFAVVSAVAEHLKTLLGGTTLQDGAMFLRDFVAARLTAHSTSNPELERRPCPLLPLAFNDE